MRRALKLSLVMAAMALVWAPLDARADGYVSPWVGVQFGSDWNNGRAGFGADAGYMGAGIIGGEAEFGYSPSFFGTKTDFGNNTVIDVMGNLIVGVPVGGTHGAGVRPYVLGGLGLIRTQIDGGSLFNVSTSNNQFGFDLGAGVMGYFNDHVGLRGDLRYFRTLQGDVVNNIDFGGFHFWRASIGVVFR